MTKAVSILRGTSCLGSTTRPFAPPAATSTSGARWAQLLRSAGAQNVQVTAHVRFPKVGDYQRTHLLSLVEAMRDRILTSGRIGEAELIAHMASLSEHLENPATTLIDKMLVQSRSEIGDDR
jgi:hypothetical protein